MSLNFTLGAEPKITIELVEGDLQLVGWDNDDALIKHPDEEFLTIEKGENSLVLSSKDDLSINIPSKSGVKINKVDGDMSVRGLKGSLNVEIINGDTSIRDVSEIFVGTVESDLSLRGAKGDVHVKSVGGDASLHAVDGGIKLDSVSDDLSIRGVGGNLMVDVDSDVVVHIDPKPEQEYSVVAGDDIMLVLPDEANASLKISAERISVNYPGVELDNSSSQNVVLGDGAAKININAGDRVLVSTSEGAAESADEFGNFAGMMFDWGDFGREIGENWGNFGRDFGERVARKAEKAARNAEAHARNMERHARRQERHARRAARKGAKFSFTFDTDKFPPMPKPSEPVSDEERISILNMLAEKKITAEQAEELLAALEGGK